MNKTTMFNILRGMVMRSALQSNQKYQLLTFITKLEDREEKVDE